jgi:tRNA (Thr-GGU) A37 N-methylase
MSEQTETFSMTPIGHIRCDGESIVLEIDAFDGTPIVDLKAYLAICDRVREVRHAPWLEGWPEWMPETGTRLMDPRDESAGG